MIGIFDSGVGGVSVLREVRAALPDIPLLYFGDNDHIPYGPRPLRQVRDYSVEITRFLLARGAQIMVVACNTASAAALQHLRQWPEFAGVPFVGMEPAVKPAAEATRTGVVGVLATPATFQGELYASVVERFAAGVRVLQETCPGLVQQIEAGALDTPETETMLRGWVEPMLAQGIDALVLGCTHYPFVIPLLEKICGPGVRVIDPAPAVARQVARVWRSEVGGQKSEVGSKREALGVSSQGVTYYTSGQTETLKRLLPVLGVEPGEVRGATWNEGGLSAN